jgi:hypothetical protein
MVHIFSPKPPNRRVRFVAAPVLVLALAVLGGCASVPPPDGQLNQAQAQLQVARDAGAADYAPMDLGFARDKFQQAQNAMASRKYDVAAELADESRADAEVATAKARLGAARAQINAKSDENGRLRSQLSEAQAEAQQQAAQSLTPPPSNTQESEMVLPSPATDAPAGSATTPTPPSDNSGGQP